MAMKIELDLYTNELITELGDDAKSLFAGQIDQARLFGIPDQSLQVGAAAPNFFLPSATGEVIELRRLLQQGPVVLAFYRGGWCPYCNIQLRSYQNVLNTLKQMKSSLVAISPETPDNTVETTIRERLEFPVLSDTNNVVARQFGLVFPVTSDVKTIFRDRWNLDLKKENGVDGGELPVPGTYVIDQDGYIIFSRADVDYRIRTEPEEILQALRVDPRTC